MALATFGNLVTRAGDVPSDGSGEESRLSSRPREPPAVRIVSGSITAMAEPATADGTRRSARGRSLLLLYHRASS